MYGASKLMMNKVIFSLMVSTSFSRPGILATVAEMALTTLSLNVKIGMIFAMVFSASKSGFMPGIPGPGGPPAEPGGPWKWVLTDALVRSFSYFSA